MSFKLGFVNVCFNAVVRRDSHQMIVEGVAGFFRSDDMFEFYALENGVFGLTNILDCDRFAWKLELAFVDFF